MIVDLDGDEVADLDEGEEGEGDEAEDEDDSDTGAGTSRVEDDAGYLSEEIVVHGQ